MTRQSGAGDTGRTTGRNWKRRANRGSLPAHLPRIETTVKICRCCEDKSERLDIVPARFRVLVTIRPKYACRTCEDGVVQAPAPARLIEGRLPTETSIAQLQYADHLPLYRQPRSTPARASTSTAPRWQTAGHAAWHLRPLHQRLLDKLKERSKLFADETTVPMLDPRSRPHQDRPVVGLCRR